ncbi:Wadjet anti-phage system protein JetD domain-containing protein [Cryobacterium sp. BB307]|uniref:Wadjet anti-phage system protein JetD domain-containing protein n=1 Tax=Cryobacterium sp. BB307 TaxID=2716317 RepID=UPI001445E9AA|nr:Wadjet anti-phage system protein JetD domain-containing protein [Cryobacterium sp. BB307]
MAASRSMVTVADARARARKLVEREQRQWAAEGGDGVRLDLVLHPPTERDAQADVGGAIAWTRSWREVATTDPLAKVGWADRNWPSVGRQSVPERCTLLGADAIATFAGASVAREWRTLRDRAGRLRDVFAAGVPATGLAPAVRAHGRTLQTLAERDFETLIDVVSWLAANPASGSRIRQLPIRGIDTKWLERHRAIVETLHAAITGSASLGLVGAPPLVRVRFLDLSLRPGGLCDVTAPVEELAAVQIAASTVFVFENLDTVLAMPELPGAVVVHGGGYAARQLGQIPWIQSGRVIYWGDLDSDGFAILNAVRSGCSNVTSVLMDEATLYAYRDLWVPETKPAAGSYPLLTALEQAALDAIRAEGNVRLEQERVEWKHALGILTAMAHATQAPV